MGNIALIPCSNFADIVELGSQLDNLEERVDLLSHTELRKLRISFFEISNSI